LMQVIQSSACDGGVSSGHRYASLVPGFGFTGLSRQRPLKSPQSRLSATSGPQARNETPIGKRSENPNS
jgi:hypothetical protein